MVVKKLVPTNCINQQRPKVLFATITLGEKPEIELSLTCYGAL